jgi:hypothetical protein
VNGNKVDGNLVLMLHQVILDGITFKLQNRLVLTEEQKMIKDMFPDYPAWKAEIK